MKYEVNKPVWMNIHDVEASQRPREKMELNGPESLSDLELIMLLVGSGSVDKTLVEVSKELLDLLDRSEEPDFRTLLAIKGMGKAKTTAILAALELGRRRRKRGQRPFISSPNDIYAQVRHFATREQEQFIVIVLNGAHEVLNTFVATIGLVNKTLVHPREIFCDAIEKRATAIAIAHNHPSGLLEPSDDDVNVTKRIILAGNILGIKVLDHIIFTEAGFFSFLEHGILDVEKTR